MGIEVYYRKMNIKNLKMFLILKEKKYLAIMLISSIFMMIFFPVMQTIATGGLQNLDLWFEVIPLVNLLLLILYSILFGFLLSLQIYHFKHKKCTLKSEFKSLSTGGISTLMAMFVPACPACLSWVTLLLPASLGVSASQILVKYNTLILLVSIVLLVFGLYALGGFKKEL